MQQQDLPQEVITDILTRLPVKSVLRFRSVSQSFCSLLDSRGFITQHLKHFLSTNSNRCLVLAGLGVYFIDLDSLDSAVVLKPPLRCSHISNSVNGLFLAIGQAPYLWNPFTRKYQELPRINKNDLPVEEGGNACFEVLGFGYDEVNDDYKVLKVVEVRGVNLRWVCSKAYVYSLRSKAWRKIGDFSYQVSCKQVWPVYVKGALHTLVFNEYSMLNPRIMAFDFATEEHRELPVPDISVKEINLVGLDVLDGFLCVLNAPKKHRRDVWIMKEYGKESWMKLLSIAPPAIEKYSTVSPLVFSKNGNEVLLNCDQKWLVWYDLNNKTTRNVPVEGLPFIFNAEVSVQSLVPFEDADKVRTQCSKQDKRRRYRKKRVDFLSEGFKLVL